MQVPDERSDVEQIWEIVRSWLVISRVVALVLMVLLASQLLVFLKKKIHRGILANGYFRFCMVYRHRNTGDNRNIGFHYSRRPKPEICPGGRAE